MPTKTVSRRCLLLVAASFAALLYAEPAAAQEVVITMYQDYYVDENGLHAEVWLTDESDMGTAVHYNYYGGASISGTTGSDIDDDPGLGPYTLFVPSDPDGQEGEWEIEAGVSFECTEGGPMYGTPTAILIFGFPMLYHYNNAGYDGDGEYGYIPKTPATAKRCKPDRVRSSQNFAEGLTLAGTQFSAPPAVTICAGLCVPDHVLFEVGLGGNGADLDHCQAFPFSPE